VANKLHIYIDRLVYCDIATLVHYEDCCTFILMCELDVSRPINIWLGPGSLFELDWIGHCDHTFRKDDLGACFKY